MDYKTITNTTAQCLTSSEVNVDGIEIPVLEGYMPFMGYKTYFRVAGAGSAKHAPLICIHGGPGGGHGTLEYLDRLSIKTGRQIITYDQLGCGNSYVDGHSELWCLDTGTQELSQLKKFLKIDHAHLLGQSWGGMLIISYLVDQSSSGVLSGILTSTLSSSKLGASEQAKIIAKFPEGARVAINNAIQTYDFSSKEYEQANEFYIRQTCCSKADEYDIECFRRGPAKGHDTVYSSAGGPNEYHPDGTLADFDYTDRLGEIKQPCLVINGGRDCCTLKVAHTMYEGIKNSEWEYFEDCRHRCYYEGGQRYLDVCNSGMDRCE